MITGIETSALEIFKWIGKNIGKDIIKSSSKTMAEKWNFFGMDKAAAEYAKKMKKIYGNMHIWGMSSPIDLEGIFTNVNVLSKPSAFKRSTKQRLEKMYFGETNFGKTLELSKNAFDAVREKQKLFILGKPGAGKTTFLKYLTITALNGHLNYLPIFINLRSFSESKLTLKQFVELQFDVCNFPDSLLFLESIFKKGKAIVLCDGLDEVNKEDNKRDKVINEILWLSEKYDKNKYVITCRIAATEYLFEGYTYVEMADFDESQVNIFVYKWFKNERDIANKFFKEFKKTRTNRLREISNNPLLLTLLCISFQETLSFPSRRSEIYEEALDALLKKWDTSRRIKRDEIYKELSLGRKRQMFARIAASTFNEGVYLFKKSALENMVFDYVKNLPPSTTISQMDGSAIVNAIEAQHGLFVERAKGIYSFSHLTFQEYYTAKYIVDNHRYSLEPLIDYYDSDNWREVFLLTAEMRDNADDFFILFLEKLDDYILSNPRIVKLLKKVKDEIKELQELKHEPFFKKNTIICLIMDTAWYTILAQVKISPKADILELAKEINNIRTIPHNIAENYPRIKFNTHPTESFTLSTIAKAATATSAKTSINKALNLFRIRSRNKDLRELKSSKKENEDSIRIMQLRNKLSHFKVPSKRSQKKHWKAFSKYLLKLMHTFMPLEDYSFSVEDCKKLKVYFYGINLVVDCLQNAYVTNRKEIEERLYNVP